MNKLSRFIILTVILTLAAFLVVINSQDLFKFILLNDKNILFSAVIILSAALVFQQKQNSVLRENEQLYEALKQKQNLIDRDMTLARKVQQGILPAEIPAIPGLKIAVGNRPAQKIGGDFYGLRKKDKLVHFFIGDVAGHGISAALLMSLSHGLIHELNKSLDDPAQILQNLNQTLCRMFTDNIVFVSLFYGLIDLNRNSLSYASAGHPAAILVGKTNQQLLEPTGAILGIFSKNKYINKKISFTKKSRLLVFTDGINDQQNFQKDQEKVFIDLLKSAETSTLETIKSELLAKARGLEDDFSFILIEKN